MYFDSNSCRANFHEFKRDEEGKWQAFHADGSVCQEAEFSLRDD
jgi:hypothetical protein